MSGTAAVAVYGVGGQINSLYVQMSTAVSTVFVPKINRIVASTNDNGELTRLMIKVGRLQFAVVSLVLVGFAFLGRSFIALWAGTEYGNAYAVAMLLMAPMTIPLIQNIGLEIQRAKNMHQARSVVYTCLAVSNLLISIPFIQRWGSVGAAAGTTITQFIGTGLFMNWYYQKRIGLNMVAFWKEIVCFAPAVLMLCLFGVAYMQIVPVKSWMMLAISAAAFASVHMVFLWLLVFTAQEKKQIKNLLRVVFHIFQRNG